MYFISNNTNVPYTGVAVSKFITGQVSGKTSFLNGVPNGTWFAYGYNNEIIQSGTYQPHLLKSGEIGSIEHAIRMNVCTVREGNQTFIDLYIVTNNNNEFDIEKKQPMFNIVVDKLKKEGLTTRTDLINKIRVVKMEL